MKKKNPIIGFFLTLAIGSLLAACSGSGTPSAPADESAVFGLATSDATGVQTTIKKKPANPSKSNKATFSFTCNSGTCTYKCSLDSGAWKACSSPKSYKNLSEGAHNFQVKASSSGKSDRTPAYYDWVVDARLDVQGILDNTSIVIGQASFSDWIETRLAALFLKSAQAGTSTAVDTIIAASPNGIYYAVLDGSTFSLAVPRGAIYILGFYKGMDLKGILTLDTATGLDSIPALETSSDFNLGTVSLDSGTGVVTATISQADAFTALGLDTDLATSIGIYDEELQVKTSVDVDGNGIMDDQEGKTITLIIAYQFTGGESFSSLNNWSAKESVSSDGYLYQFQISPDRPALDWNNATLVSPQDINGGNNTLQSYLTVTPEYRAVSFFSGNNATTPMPPPTGTYVVQVGSHNFTFDNMSSISIDPNLNEVYVPTVKLTFDGAGKVTQLEWQIYKKSGGIWSQASQSEMDMIMFCLEFSLLKNGSVKISKLLPKTPAGSTAVPQQNFVPEGLCFYTSTFAGYSYWFCW